MFGVSKIRQLQQMAQNPRESEMARSFASILARYEHDLLDSVANLHRALELDEPLTVDQTPDERVEKLLDVAEAAAGGDFETFWFGEVAGFENPEEVADFVGFSEEEWRDQIDTWADRYRSKAPEEFEEDSDREIAAWHVEGEFGVPLEEFEREVVGYSRRDALKSALGGNIAAGIAGVQRATRAARGATGGDKGGGGE
jgi:hypothetical protein